MGAGQGTKGPGDLGDLGTWALGERGPGAWGLADSQDSVGRREGEKSANGSERAKKGRP